MCNKYIIIKGGKRTGFLELKPQTLRWGGNEQAGILPTCERVYKENPSQVTRGFSLLEQDNLTKAF